MMNWKRGLRSSWRVDRRHFSRILANRIKTKGVVCSGGDSCGCGCGCGGVGVGVGIGSGDRLKGSRMESCDGVASDNGSSRLRKSKMQDSRRKWVVIQGGWSMGEERKRRARGNQGRGVGGIRGERNNGSDGSDSGRKGRGGGSGSEGENHLGRYKQIAQCRTYVLYRSQPVEADLACELENS
ncbi:hypothetical protein M426DRAFT_82014 [Hypoxylon sp. CI-4A]|nr:hypothetical protein M426DRAFT_82014 [Hypoxylon sp. CI-4A]